MGDFPSAVPAYRIALSLLLLTAQVLLKNSPLSLVRINMLTNGFVADGQLRGNLLRTPLHAQQDNGFIFHPRSYRTGVSAVRVAFNHQFTCLLWRIPAKAGTATQLAADLRIVASDKTGNLVSFNLTEAFVIHRATSTCRSGSLEC